MQENKTSSNETAGQPEAGPPEADPEAGSPNVHPPPEAPGAEQSAGAAHLDPESDTSEAGTGEPRVREPIPQAGAAVTSSRGARTGEPGLKATEPCSPESSGSGSADPEVPGGHVQRVIGLIDQPNVLQALLNMRQAVREAVQVNHEMKPSPDAARAGAPASAPRSEHRAGPDSASGGGQDELDLHGEVRRRPVALCPSLLVDAAGLRGQAAGGWPGRLASMWELAPGVRCGLWPAAVRWSPLFSGVVLR